jgi:hypothetical protein
MVVQPTLNKQFFPVYLLNNYPKQNTWNCWWDASIELLVRAMAFEARSWTFHNSIWYCGGCTMSNSHRRTSIASSVVIVPSVGIVGVDGCGDGWPNITGVLALASLAKVYFWAFNVYIYLTWWIGQRNCWTPLSDGEPWHKCIAAKLMLYICEADVNAGKIVQEALDVRWWCVDDQAERMPDFFWPNEWEREYPP